jgi:response regulator of citrate/malate metabolism
MSAMEVNDRINKLHRTVKARSSTGKEYLYRLPNEIVSGIVRDFMTGDFTAKEIADKWDVSESTVSKYVEFYLKDYKQIKQLSNND